MYLQTALLCYNHFKYVFLLRRPSFTGTQLYVTILNKTREPGPHPLPCAPPSPPSLTPSTGVTLYVHLTPRLPASISTLSVSTTLKVHNLPPLLPSIYHRPWLYPCTSIVHHIYYDLGLSPYFPTSIVNTFHAYISTYLPPSMCTSSEMKTFS